MEDLSNTMSVFSHISLSDMDNVKLMSRTDTKFAFSSNKLSILLNKISPFYHILSINNNLIHDYKSLYYDTGDFKFYFDHHNQRVNRHKVRFREYVGSGLTFLEVKCKNNKGRTIKKRMKVKKIATELSKEHKDYLTDIIGKDYSINPKQHIDFSRMTFVHKQKKERLTIDINLTFSCDQQEGDFKQIVIAEVKQERMSRSSDFMRIAKEMSILPIRLSKYCMSILELNSDIKQNRFKRKKRFINKLKNI